MHRKDASSSILLSTINARYIHAAFGLRYLLANMGDLRAQTTIREWTIKERPTRMIEDIEEAQPAIVGLGVYIWNLPVATELVTTLKALRPDVVVVLGGPEVSYEAQDLPIVQAADYVIAGEADLAFADLCRQVLRGDPPASKWIRPPLPPVAELTLPYALYSPHDISHRVVYVELSRGCPFRCEFCLSSLELPVRTFERDAFLQAMDDLYARGLRQFKFVDRTFNLNLRVSEAILRFFLDRLDDDLFLHFEMVPDRFPERLRSLVQQFPPGVLQFEVGIQTFHEEVAARINRRQDNAKIDDNLRFLREETGVHVHADLIAGLPGEDLDSFAAGFDHLVSLQPQEIQLGILKRLRGTPIARHSDEWGLVFNPNPPYEILQTHHIDFASMQHLHRFSQLWDRYANSGNFRESLPLLWKHDSPFWRFWTFSQEVVRQLGQSHSISLVRQMEQLFAFLVHQQGEDAQTVADVLWADYTRSGRTKLPAFLRPYRKHHDTSATEETASATSSSTPTRQARHLSD